MLHSMSDRGREPSVASSDGKRVDGNGLMERLRSSWRDGRESKRLVAHRLPRDAPVLCVAFDREGQHVATGYHAHALLHVYIEAWVVVGALTGSCAYSVQQAERSNTRPASQARRMPFGSVPIRQRRTGTAMTMKLARR